MNTWHEIWERKGSEITDLNLRSLITANGFDTGLVNMSLEDWNNIAQGIYGALNLRAGDKVLEVGAGSGAMLFAVAKNRDIEVYGIDYSNPLIELAKRVNGYTNLQCCEAIDMQFQSDFFDGIFSHSVFQYFPDYAYAENVIEKIIRFLKPRQRGLILDIPNWDLWEECENARRSCLSPAVYERLYKDLKHLYYKKTWFKKILKTHGCKIEEVKYFSKNYFYKKYRFNILFEKNSRMVNLGMVNG